MRLEKNEAYSSGWAGFGARKQQIAQAEAVDLHFIEEAAGPDVFGGKNAEAEHDGKPTGTREENHHKPDREQGEAKENPEGSFGLLHGADHFSDSLDLCIRSLFCHNDYAC